VESVLREAAYYLTMWLQAIALLLIAVGSVEALVAIARTIRHAATGTARRAVWMGFARWLIAALTFQLAADIVQTSFSPSWDELGRLGAVAVIRTFLSYFLDREVETTRALPHDTSGVRPG